MTSRERVFRTLEFRSPDRAPRNLWALPAVNLFQKAEHDAVLRDFPDDLTGCWGLGPSDRSKGQGGRRGSHTDEWGCVWEAAEDGVAGEVKHPPLEDWSALASFTAPWEMLQRADWGAACKAQDANLASPNPRFMNYGTSIRPFERLQFLRGSENLFMDMGEGSREFFKLREMVHEFFLKDAEGAARTNSDGAFFMDDWGSQNSLLISPAMWREYFKPLYREYCDIFKKAGKKIFFHSDGHIDSICEDLIELGINALNSQLFCMDIESLAKRFKGRITFWGEIDRQHILPFGTVEDVRRAVGRVRRALDDGKGGVIAQCEWGVRNPPENIRAIFEAWEAPISSLP